MKTNPIMIMAGGTGGHVYPALAVADYLRAKDIPLFWLGTTRGIESRVVPEHGIELLTIMISGVRGKGLPGKLVAPVKILTAILQALYICIRRRPAAVLGMGGFASGPGGIAAWLLRIPLLIHEQNRIAGTTNRILARFAVKVMQGFPDTFRAGSRVVTTGNPVRREIVELSISKTGKTAKRPNILVLGGSQGAQQLNRVLPPGLDRLQGRLKVNVWHQCGAKNLAETERLYGSLQLDQVRVDAFITDMAAAYAWADIAICRAGALTIAELCAAGLASVLIPFPYAIDDHQTANARYLSDAGAALLLPEHELTEDRVAELLWQLCSEEDSLPGMRQKIRSYACPDAAQAVGSLCLEEAYA